MRYFCTTSWSHSVIIHWLYSWSTTTPLIIFHIKKGFKFRNHCTLREPFVKSVCFVSSISSLQSFFFCTEDRHDAFTTCEEIQGTVGFRIPRLGFRIPYTVHVFCCWNLFSGLQSLVGVCRIPQEKFSRIPNSKGKIRKVEILIPLHAWGAIHFTVTEFYRNLS